MEEGAPFALGGQLQLNRRRAIDIAKRLGERLGYDIHRRDLSHPARRVSALRAHHISTVLDVGANRGQYVGWLRDFGYDGRMVSFEPLPAEFRTMSETHSRDPRWQGINAAVGAAAGTAQLHVTRSTLLSSILDPAAALTTRISAAATTSTIDVPVVALDDVWTEHVTGGERVLLKIDTQGFEHQVLDGVAAHLGEIEMVEIEMALIEMYSGGSTIHTVLPRLYNAGFEVISIESGFAEANTGQVLDVDVLLGRPLTASAE